MILSRKTSEIAIVVGLLAHSTTGKLNAFAIISTLFWAPSLFMVLDITPRKLAVDVPMCLAASASSLLFIMAIITLT